MSRDITLLLMSNASLDLYPENKPNNFIVQLQRPLEVYGDWVIGMREIHFPLEFKDRVDKSKLSPEYDVSVPTEPNEIPEPKKTRKRKRAVPTGEVRHAYDDDPDDDIEPYIIPDDELVEYGVNYLENQAVIAFDIGELRKRVESHREYLPDILDDIIARDRASRKLVG